MSFLIPSNISVSIGQNQYATMYKNDPFIYVTEGGVPVANQNPKTREPYRVCVFTITPQNTLEVTDISDLSYSHRIAKAFSKNTNALSLASWKYLNNDLSKASLNTTIEYLNSVREAALELHSSGVPLATIKQLIQFKHSDEDLARLIRSENELPMLTIDVDSSVVEAQQLPEKVYNDSPNPEISVKELKSLHKGMTLREVSAYYETSAKTWKGLAEYVNAQILEGNLSVITE